MSQSVDSCGECSTIYRPLTKNAYSLYYMYTRAHGDKTVYSFCGKTCFFEARGKRVFQRPWIMTCEAPVEIIHTYGCNSNSEGSTHDSLVVSSLPSNIIKSFHNRHQQQPLTFYRQNETRSYYLRAYYSGDDNRGEVPLRFRG